MISYYDCQLPTSPPPLRRYLPGRGPAPPRLHLCAAPPTNTGTGRDSAPPRLSLCAAPPTNTAIHLPGRGSSPPRLKSCATPPTNTGTDLPGRGFAPPRLWTTFIIMDSIVRYGIWHVRSKWFPIVTVFSQSAPCVNRCVRSLRPLRLIHGGLCPLCN